MHYLLLAYGDERLLGAMSAGERETLERACRENDEALDRSGRLVAAAMVEGFSAATVRASRGAVAVDEGPLSATSARLRAVFMIAARDLNEAIQVAAAMPQARAGPIEVRPLLEPRPQ
jgi:hypothetical protein